MKVRRSCRRFVGSILSAAALLGFGAGVPAGAQDVEEINILTANNSTCTNYVQFVGPELGLAEMNGIKWNLLDSETTIPFVAFLETGDAQVVMLDAPQVLQMGKANFPGKVVYEIYTFATEGIVVPADSEIKSLADLRDTTIGLASDRDQITTIITMDSIGESLESMNIKTVVVGESGPLLASALSSGEIDAFAGGSSDRNAIVAAGLQIRNITPAEVTENPANNYAISDDDLEASWPLKFLRTYAMGQMAGAMDTRAIMAICRHLVPEQWETPGVGEKLVNDAVYIYNVSRSRLRGEIRPWIWEKIQGPYIKIGELDELIPASEFTDDRFLEDANTFETYDVYEAIQAWKDAHPELLTW